VASTTGGADLTRKALLHVRAETGSLPEIQAWLETHACRLGAAPASIPALMLAVEECVNNIAIHGYGRERGDVELEMTRRSNVLILRIKDNAVTFNPLAMPAPELSTALDERPIGGLGIHLVRKSVDRVRYRTPSAGGNQLTLLLRMQPEGSEARPR
jgi:serine/threonine-protein kinase RsbW